MFWVGYPYFLIHDVGLDWYCFLTEHSDFIACITVGILCEIILCFYKIKSFIVLVFIVLTELFQAYDGREVEDLENIIKVLPFYELIWLQRT